MVYYDSEEQDQRLGCFTDENNSKYLNVLNDFLSYNINIIKVFVLLMIQSYAY
ncbi:lipopolysaccharide core heptose(II) kinase RfaY [Escherichia coli]|uniref:lipopolysaccharide core heptose(II) kinase RfaY n=1 Tax=Escherichia coli TaxID=562 RepID=UPI003EB96A4C